MDQALVKEEEEEEDVATGGVGSTFFAGESSRSRDMGWCPYSLWLYDFISMIIYRGFLKWGYPVRYHPSHCFRSMGKNIWNFAMLNGVAIF